ncbi:MAG: family glycosyltransferase [Rhodocyclales bacterium]|nr:family glycosyltransferase [Rhodocyclales bacterium]
MDHKSRRGAWKAEHLANITLVVPTYNRHELFCKLLDYYASLGLAMQILVLDSSCESLQHKNRKHVLSLGSGFRHISYSSDVPVASKLSQGLHAVGTEYAALCADDDLVFLDGLIGAKAFLQDHPEYVCVDGIYLNYWQKEFDVNVKIEYGSGGINGEHAYARVFRLFQKYESLFYGVFRTKHITQIFDGVSKIQSLHFQELFQAVSALMIGKSHRLPLFYAARQSCDPAQPERDKWQTFQWFADDRAEFLAHYALYRTSLLSFYKSNISESSRIDEAGFFKAMDLAHSIFFATGCPQWYFFSELKHLWSNDAFQNVVSGTEALDQLKSAGRLDRERKAARLISNIGDSVRRCFSTDDIEKLNKTIQANHSNPWLCIFHDHLEWLAESDQFKGAYDDLCSYLEGSDRQPLGLLKKFFKLS